MSVTDKDMEVNTGNIMTLILCPYIEIIVCKRSHDDNVMMSC